MGIHTFESAIFCLPQKHLLSWPRWEYRPFPIGQAPDCFGRLVTIVNILFRIRFDIGFFLKPLYRKYQSRPLCAGCRSQRQSDAGPSVRGRLFHGNCRSGCRAASSTSLLARWPRAQMTEVPGTRICFWSSVSQRTPSARTSSRYNSSSLWA